MAENQTTYVGIMSSPIGRIGLVTNAEGLSGLEFVAARRSLLAPVNDLAQNVFDQLEQYFSNPEHAIELQLSMVGTTFQKKVWAALRKIPSGSVVTYGALAQSVGSSARAVGNACRANPIPIVVPCHRVVAKTGVGGYMGKTRGSKLQLKKWLLDHEQR